MRVGILGGGQLAQMLALAAHPMGIKTLCYEPAANACAGQVTQLIRAEYSDTDALKAFAQQVDVITYENENIDHEIIDTVNQYKPVYPSRAALITSQDRLHEKSLFQHLEIPTVDFAAVDIFESLQKACEKIGFPALLKTRRFGYDGKGQMLIQNVDDMATAWDQLGNAPLILEQFTSFQRELSLITVCDQQGNCQFYPLTENQHRQGILRLSRAPYDDQSLQLQAQQIASTLCREFDYVGVLAIEFFQVGDKLLVNEIAPRVHNSGHWTIEGAACSQFENHLRAICDLPLGNTRAHGYSAMINCIGEMPSLQSILQQVANAHVHDYGKTARALRKLGHITLRTDNAVQLDKQLELFAEVH